MDKPVQIDGIQPSRNVTCKGQNAAGTVVTYGLGTREQSSGWLGVSCTRASDAGPNDQAFYREATIQVATNAGPYDIFWPKGEKLAENMAEAIQKELGDQQNTITQVQQNLAKITNGGQAAGSDQAILNAFRGSSARAASSRQIRRRPARPFRRKLQQSMLWRWQRREQLYRN